MINKSTKIESYYNSIASQRDLWLRKNWYYYNQITSLFKFLIPHGQKIIEIGCGTGTLLSSLNPAKGVGVDLAENMISIAKKNFPKLQFVKGSAENITIHEKFDYIILSDLIGSLFDVQQAFLQLHKISKDDTRIIITHYNELWEPFLRLGEKLGLKMAQPVQNWLSKKDIKNFLELSNFELVEESSFLLFPFYIPFFSLLVNRYIARFPLINKLCLITYFVVRPQPTTLPEKEYSVSLIIPARNEAGNIERAVLKIPKLGKKTELIFIEGHSKDNTKEEIGKVIKKYKGKKEIVLINQKNGVGKGDAVRRGFAAAKGDIVMIFDADLTVDPVELPKFYDALSTGKAEYIQGSRLVYPMEKQAMRILNIAGNKFFSSVFTYLLDQPIKDTLCGTKGLFKKNYEKIAKNRSYFGDFDPFGDFDLIFGASKLHLKIMEIPIRYKARTYGTTNISRFRHGWLLLKMTLFASEKIKFF